MVTQGPTEGFRIWRKFRVFSGTTKQWEDCDFRDLWGSPALATQAWLVLRVSPWVLEYVYCVHVMMTQTHPRAVWCSDGVWFFGFLSIAGLFGMKKQMDVAMECTPQS